jgi:uncharacterized protein (DUF2267 family)
MFRSALSPVEAVFAVLQREAPSIRVERLRVSLSKQKQLWL